MAQEIAFEYYPDPVKFPACSHFSGSIGVLKGDGTVYWILLIASPSVPESTVERWRNCGVRLDPNNCRVIGPIDS